MATAEFPTETSLDFVQLMREQMYEDTQGMNRDEIMAYIHAGAEKFHRKMEEVNVDDFDFAFLEKK